MSSNEQIPLRKLSTRDMAVVLQADRYRITTVALARRGPLDKISRSGASKIMNRLARSGFLKAFCLIHPERYFVIGEAGARLLGRNDYRTRPLGPQSLPTDYATALHCFHSKSPRRRLTQSEIQAMGSWLTDCPSETPICIDESSGTLELIRIDLGGPADHVARKCFADIERRMQTSGFRSAVESGALRIVIITGTKEKEVAIRIALGRHTWPVGLQFHCSVVTNVLLLIARKNRA